LTDNAWQEKQINFTETVDTYYQLFIIYLFYYTSRTRSTQRKYNNNTKMNSNTHNYAQIINSHQARVYHGHLTSYIVTIACSYTGEAVLNLLTNVNSDPQLAATATINK